MLIKLTESKLFTQDPAIRFAREYNVPESLWRELWKRRQLMEYTPTELREYFQIKTGRKMGKMTIHRWIFRSEVYSMSNPLMKKGVQVVQSEFFKHNEDDVIAEITRHLRFGDTKASKILA